MKHIATLLSAALLVVAPGLAGAQTGHEMHGMAMDHGDAQMAAEAGPEDARDPNAYADGTTLTSGAYALPGPRQMVLADEHHFGRLLIDRLEHVHTDAGRATAYEIDAAFGRDFDRFAVRAEGEYAGSRIEHARTELLWRHAVAAFWDSHLGLRYDSGNGSDRRWLAVGIEGLAPYWFDVEATAYFGDNGRSALRLAADYELLLGQRVVLQPRIEANVYGRGDEGNDIGSGLSNVTVGVRLRYEISRQFAPYFGVERDMKSGQTADIARAAGTPDAVTRWVAGVRIWF